MRLHPIALCVLLTFSACDTTDVGPLPQDGTLTARIDGRMFQAERSDHGDQDDTLYGSLGTSDKINWYVIVNGVMEDGPTEHTLEIRFPVARGSGAGTYEAEASYVASAPHPWVSLGGISVRLTTLNRMRAVGTFAFDLQNIGDGSAVHVREGRFDVPLACGLAPAGEIPFCDG